AALRGQQRIDEPFKLLRQDFCRTADQPFARCGACHGGGDVDSVITRVRCPPAIRPARDLPIEIVTKLMRKATADRMWCDTSDAAAMSMICDMNCGRVDHGKFDRQSLRAESR